MWLGVGLGEEVGECVEDGLGFVVGEAGDEVGVVEVGFGVLGEEVVWGVGVGGGGVFVGCGGCVGVGWLCAGVVLGVCGVVAGRFRVVGG